MKNPVRKSLASQSRVELKQREVSHDSDEKPPKAKAKVQIKKQKVQLPGHQNPIEAPTVKPPKDEEDDEPHPNASSSNDQTIPLPTTTPHSFTPAQPGDEAEYDTPQSSQDTIPYQDVETEEPIITEDDVEHLNSNGDDTTQPYDSEFVKFEGEYFFYISDTIRQLPISSPMMLLVSDSFVSILRRMERKRRRKSQ